MQKNLTVSERNNGYLHVKLLLMSLQMLIFSERGRFLNPNLAPNSSRPLNSPSLRNSISAEMSKMLQAEANRLRIFGFQKKNISILLRFFALFPYPAYRKFYSKFCQYYPPLLTILACGRIFLNDSIDFIPVFVHNKKKINFLKTFCCQV